MVGGMARVTNRVDRSTLRDLVVAPRPGARTSLVLDDGGAWFARRAVTIRGTLSPCPPPAGAGGRGARWLEPRPERITAWDYGRRHEQAAP
jgi:hypothetical protein